MPDTSIFGKTIDSLIDLYKNIAIPTIILDENLQIIWYNNSATRKMPSLSTYGGFQTIINEKDKKKISAWRDDKKRQENHLKIEQVNISGAQILLNFTLFPCGNNSFVFLCTIENLLYDKEDCFNELKNEKTAFFNLLKELDYNIREPLFSSFSAIDSAKIVIKDMATLYNESFENTPNSPNNEKSANEKAAILNLYLDSIYASNYKILKLCINTSKYNKLKNHIYSHNEKPPDIVCLNDILNEVCHVLHITTQEHDTSFFYNIPTEKMVVKTNVDDFLLAIFNILSNAFLYEKHNKKNSVSLTLTKNKNFAEIKISDQGLGMSEEKVNNLFSYLYEKNEKNNLVSGLGLGVPVSKLCIENMGGIFEIESKEGAGTTVTIKLPLKSQIKTDILTMKQESEETFIQNKYSYLYVILVGITKMPMGG